MCVSEWQWHVCACELSLILAMLVHGLCLPPELAFLPAAGGLYQAKCMYNYDNLAFY